MTNAKIAAIYDLVKSMDKKLSKLLKKKRKRNKHKPPAPTYMDK